MADVALRAARITRNEIEQISIDRERCQIGRKHRKRHEFPILPECRRVQNSHEQNWPDKQQGKIGNSRKNEN
jgi:hypothetical protein